MDDDSVLESFHDAPSSDAFSPEPEPIKAKAPAKKATAALPKAKPAPKMMSQTTLKTSKSAPKKRAKPSSDDENSDHDSQDDDSLLSNTPPSAKRQKKAPAAKKSGGKPLQPIDNESIPADGTTNISTSKKPRKDQYEKLTQLEHILKRPDTYIGSVERTTDKMWVYNSQTELMEFRDVSYVPGLYKIFDEILVNAADNKQRDKNMSEIRVTIDPEEGKISVLNDGKGIPIEIHDKEGIYIPEMIFGHLLTSSNYDDDQAKVTGGRNGFGAKLCNVFSTKFVLETVDSKTKQKYQQTWTQNMSKMGEAKITKGFKGDDYTKITFYPDFGKFGMDRIDEDFEGLVKRRVYDMAGTCKDVKASLNGERIKIRNFKKYMEMYTKAITAETAPSEDVAPKETQVILTDNPHERWEIGFAVSDGSFQQVSFVNSIATTAGGTHVNFVADQIITKLMDIVKRKNKGGVALKPAQIKNHIFLFVNCLIVNPAFTSQTKEQLTTKASQFGSKPTVSEKFLKDIAKTEAVDNILHFAQRKADQVLKKSDGNRRTRMNNSKLTDANKAGTSKGHECTLILTEGDSASLLALAGRAVVDPDRIGVFPLRGKLLNVRDASIDQISKNAEIQNIKQFMGLQHKKSYEDTRGLRYGHLMIMTDQDHDGSHIKGLLINFLEVQFPSLLRIPGFLKEFITPIVKVWKGDPKNPKKLQSFFTMPEYEAWKEIAGNCRGWEHKYFKGLGTSSPSDAEVYFRDLDRHLKEFSVIKPEEPPMIDLAFSKKKADARKEWLRQFRPGTFLDMTTPEITYDDFINKELILFSMADNERSIPSVIDGFKPGQRKVLYTCFRRNLKKDVKVVELAGSVSGLTAYAYGDTSLQQTIVGLAQNFVGSNNINCLEPSGNFGSRLQGGSDCASARYIYTRLSPFARKIFHTTDEALLSYHKDDGKTIEPQVYAPILPMILVNGADGIGTGWSSSIPNYNPVDIVENLKRRMAGTKDDMLPMTPWFRNWCGQCVDLGGDRFKFTGTIRQTGDNEVEVTELPIRIWTQDFKDKLEEIIKAEKVPSFIKDYTEYNTPVKVHFIIKLEDKHMAIAMERGLEETFKLNKSLATSNLVAFDSQGRINKYATVLDIMEEFYVVRLKFYEQRKRHMLGEMEAELDKMNNQARFVKMIIDGTLVVSRKKKQALVLELREKDFKPIPKVNDARKEGEFEPLVDPNEDPEEDQENLATGAGDYDYLLGMAIWSLTQERIDKLMKQVGDKEAEYKKLTGTSPKELWMVDLEDFIQEWHFQLADDAKRAADSRKQGRRASTKLRIGVKGPSKKRKADESASDSEFEATKPKKAAAGKAKPSKMHDFFKDQKAAAPKSTAASKALANAFESSNTAQGVDEVEVDTKPAPKDAPLKQEAVDVPAPKASKPTASAAAKPAKRKTVISDDDDENVFNAVAQEAAEKSSTTAGARQPRAAARKPVKYTKDSSDVDSDASSSNGNDLLGDVSSMIKGVPKSNTASQPESKSLFSAPASRPSSSAGPIAKAAAKTSKTAKAKKPPIVDLEEDETDYTSLMPKGSPQKPAAYRAGDVRALGDDEDDDLNMQPAKSALIKTNGKLGGMKKAATARQTSVQAKTKPPLIPWSSHGGSPAAKAYAAKLAKAAAAKGKKKNGYSDDEDDDMNDLIDDILTDDDGVKAKPGVSKTATAPSGRPSRRAAAAPAARSKYVVGDDDEDEDDYDRDGDAQVGEDEESEASYGEDSE